MNRTLQLRLGFCGCALSLFVSGHVFAQSVIAHRGDSINAPGNTLASIRSAQGSTDLLEMDVRRTRDGELMLMHDARINDTTNGFGFMMRMTRDRIRSMDAGCVVLTSVLGRKSADSG